MNEPKKRQSKKKVVEAETTEVVELVCKKRGRKPKGGKIIAENMVQETAPPVKPNIILHLKCSLKDLDTIGEYNSNFTSSNIDPYNTDIIKSEYGQYDSIEASCNQTQSFTENTVINEDLLIDTKEIWKKLKVLEHNLHINNISDKKSACFWCTCDFDNPSIYIPKYQLKEVYYVYGCFCSPECGVAYLMNENIDHSNRFERYALLNHIYSKIYDYNKNIKPAPNPFYILDKFYGNLSIQEYRALLKSHRLYLMIDKPLTRILPEYYDDNDDFIINHKVIPTSIQNQVSVKKKIRGSQQAYNDNL
jgi:hypothetical protein